MQANQHVERMRRGFEPLQRAPHRGERALAANGAPAAVVNSPRPVEGDLELAHIVGDEPVETRAHRQHAVRRDRADHPDAVGATDFREAARQGLDDVPGGQRLPAEELDPERLQSLLRPALHQVEDARDEPDRLILPCAKDWQQ